MIDEKGRLFGKINVVDLLVLVVVVILVAVLGFKLLGRRNTGGADSAGSSSTLVYTVQVTQVNPAVYEDVQRWIPGDQLMSGSDLLNGCYVTAVEAKPHQVTGSVSASDGTRSVTFPVDGNDLLDLTFTIEANVGYTLANTVGIQEVRTGKSHTVKTQHFELTGTILSCDWEDSAAEAEPAA